MLPRTLKTRHSESGKSFRYGKPLRVRGSLPPLCPFSGEDGSRACSCSGRISNCLLWSISAGIPDGCAKHPFHGKLPRRAPAGGAISHDLTPLPCPPSPPLPPVICLAAQPHLIPPFWVFSQYDSIHIEKNDWDDFRRKLKEYLDALSTFINAKIFSPTTRPSSGP